MNALARRSPVRLRPDPSRVITRMFVPGQEGFDEQDSRTGAVVRRVLALDEDEAEAALEDVIARFQGRHRHLLQTFRRHASEVEDRLDAARPPSETKRLLLGAAFTSECAVEGAALCNPSIVAHPDQTGVHAGSLRFLMSVRAIGEGHRSSIGFRSGTVDATGQVTIESCSPLATVGTVTSAPLRATPFRTELRRLGSHGENADFILDPLGPRFTEAALAEQLGRLQDNLTTRRRAEQTISLVKAIAERTYAVHFSEETSLSERVLWPSVSAESSGMEDARFVRFTDDDGVVAYFGTYTAYDGSHISQQILETIDFRAFTSSPVVGAAATNKGLALFPRRIGGRFAALSRHDRETNRLALSDDPHEWATSVPLQSPSRSWEVVQLGNCGSPLETEAGWLALTHGVGPMRTYSIGAMLLDLDDPSRILGQLRFPLITAADDERDGYVPNVVYSCGALIHAGNLILPYGIGDADIGFAAGSLSDLLAELEHSTDR